MSIILDHRLREQIPYAPAEFPITFFCNELASLPNFLGPLHWHPDFEIATAVHYPLEFQIDLQHIILQPGESIFINGNVLHSIRQMRGDEADPMPNIVFSGALVAPENTAIYQNYIRPIAHCESLPYVTFHQDDGWHGEVNRLVESIYRRLQARAAYYEMAVQRELCAIIELIVSHLNALPRCEAYRVQFNARIRLHKMLSYIYEHYVEDISLRDIASAAHVSRTEADRCFKAFLGSSPVEALIQHRLQMAYRRLKDTTQTLQEICYACGFNSVSYFCRQFRRVYGCTPGYIRKMGK